MKKTKRIEIGNMQEFYADCNYMAPAKIDDMLLWLTLAKSNGATHIQWFGFYEDEVSAQAYMEREETDDEYNARMDDEILRKASALERERAMYEQLKRKFEP